MAPIYSVIRSTGSSLSNDPAAEPGGESREPHPTVSTAETAARQALDDADGSPADVDFLVIATTSPDIVFPNMSCLLQERLGMRGCAASSIEAGTTGFIYALSVMDRFITTGQANCALVIGADTLTASSDSRRADAQGECVAAAGAVVLEPGVAPGIVSCQLGANRQFMNLTAGALKSAVEGLRVSIDEARNQQPLNGAGIDRVIAQQVDQDLIGAVAVGLGVTTDTFILPSEDHRDLAAAKIPLTLDNAIRDGRTGRGDLLLLMALGGAVAWGSALTRL